MVERIEFEQQIMFAVHQRIMWTIGLVEAEDVIIDIQGLHVDGAVRSISHGIDANLCPTRMHEIGDLADRID
ncbi:hypothetical protein D3C87_2065210 [compost metagenome]